MDSKSAPSTFARTSDIVGAHMRKDLESYLALIRRKIQEKVGTTQDLIQQIRRNKIGDSGHVTPNEFRFTLIKFGVILPQPLVDRIFHVFDSDRSGTMDFDEFAVWIMNSEFRPSIVQNEDPVIAKQRDVNERNSYLRTKLNKCIELNSSAFKSMKKSVSFTEWVGMVDRGSMPITEKEARAIFLLFDPTDTGFMAAAHLLQWAKTGDLSPPPPSASSKKVLDDVTLDEGIRKVAGKNLQMVEKSFIHLPRNEGVRVPFEEFRRCLLANGLGRNVMEARQLFNALGGKSGTASIDTLMDSVSSRGPENPQNLVSAKRERGQVLNLSAADRRLREALRKSFLEIKAACTSLDKAGTGYIGAQELHGVIQKLAIPMSFQDFRYIVQNIAGAENGSKVHLHHFLEAYNPRNLPHQLQGGLGVIQEAASKTVHSPVSTLRDSRSAGAADLRRSQSEGKFGVSGKETLKKSLSINDDVRAVDPNGDLRRIWQLVLRECHRQDPERSGCVNRRAFINALELASASKVMSAEAMSKLADKYDAGFGLVNYLACFRTYLTALTSQSQATLKDKDSSLNTKAEVRENRAHHPWEFGYEKRARHNAQPYWKGATSQPKDINAPAQLDVVVPSANERAAHQLSDVEKQALLGQYNSKVLQACAKVYRDLGNGGSQWKELRNEMKTAQINSQRGCLLTTSWYALAEKYGVKLGVSSMNNLVRAFRGLGNQDVLKFNDLVRVCTIVGAEAS